MNLKLIVLALLVSLNATSAAPRSELEIGMAHYQAGEFKQAVAHFQFALKANPHDAESYYWIGLSYQGLADLAVPFSSRHSAHARLNLEMAAQLAPERRDYRRALFNLLLESAVSSRECLRQASALLDGIPHSDLDYESMRQQMEQEMPQNNPPEERLARLLLFLPQTLSLVSSSATANRTASQP